MGVGESRIAAGSAVGSAAGSAVGATDAELYRRFVEKLELRYFFYSHDLSGVFTYVSPSLTQVLGYEPEEFRRHFTTYLTESSLNLETVHHTNLSIQGIQQPPYLVEIKHKNGSIRLLEVAEYPARDDGGNIVAVEGVAQDVTEVQQGETALRDANQHLKILVDAAPMAIFALDAEGNALSWNNAAERIFGWRAEEVIGCQLPIVPPGQENEFHSLVRRVIAGESVLGVERSRIRRNGSTVEVAISALALPGPDGPPCGLIAYVEDITERKRSATAMRESETKFGVLFEQMNDAAFLACAESGLILDANRKAELLLGKTRSEIIGMHQDELHPAERRDEYRRIFSAHVRMGHSPQTPVEVVRADEKRVPVEISSSTMIIDGRRVILGLFRDVTERHRIHEELQQRYESEMAARGEAEAAVQARDEFLLVAAHDLKTPLATLKIQTDGMRKMEASGRLAPPVIEKGLKLIERQVERLIHLERSLMELALINEGKFELVKSRCDLAEIVQEVTGRYAPLLERAHCALESALGCGATGFWDRDRVERIVENLLSNAAKFGAGHPIRVDVTAAGEMVRLTISDQGVGIPSDQQERIFERFDRGSTATHYGGMGMGLFIVSKIVNAHSGAIRVESSPHQGASFIVELPIEA